MKNTFKQNLLLILFAAIVFAGLLNFGTVIDSVLNIIGIMSPVLLGFMIAFILNVPMKGYEKILHKLFSKSKKPPKEKKILAFSLILTLLSVVLVLVLVFWLLIPTLVDSLVSLYYAFLKQLPGWINILKDYGINTELLTQWLDKMNLEELIKNISSNAGSLITSVVGFASTAVSGVSSFAISFILGIYVMLCKKDLGRQAKLLARAHLKPHVRIFVFHVGQLISDTYSKFLSGQCLEACILGALIFASFSIARVPYASLIGVLTTVLAFVPYVGSFLSCAIGAFLVLIADPSKVILAIIVYFVVQFIETQLIYPHVVGNSVGLSSLWTLVAVILGGKLFGILGMIFFIPVMAVIITLIEEYTMYILKKQEFPDDDPDDFQEFVEAVIDTESKDE